jgi:ketosteroid isomerase-like protein
MKKQFILCCIPLIAIAPICFGQASPAKSGKSSKSSSNESAITDLEKSAWEAYKNKQADAFKALMSKDYYGVYEEGVKNLDSEVADMAKTDLHEYSFADVKVVFPHPNVAVMTYKATVKASSGGKDMSGTYNSGSVWIQQGGKWVGAFHTEAKAQ